MIGICYLNLSEYNKSIEYFKKADKLFNNKDIKTLYNLGLAYIFKQDYNNAAKTFKNGIQINPDYSLFHYQLIDVYNSLNKSREARKECEILYMLDRELFYSARFCNN